MNRFERRPRITLLVLLGTSLLLFAGALEVGLRLADAFDPYDLQYYTKAAPDQPGTYRAPYGTVRFNSHGFPDEEFDLADPRPRVGYFGDSVTFGVGAGHGHRISDHLSRTFAGHQHFTFARVGAGIQQLNPALELVRAFRIDKYLYLMNLNDLLPRISDPATGETRTSTLRRIKASRLFVFVDQLRLRSHLYNLLRIRTRNLLMALGFTHQGFPAYELWPTRHANVLDETVGRINHLHELLRERGVGFCIAILPYEMQVSAEAERFFASQGVAWEDGFIERSTQRGILGRLDGRIEALDTYFAFVREGAEAADRAQNEMAQYFVSRGGGAMDWNHLNRAGHRAVARFLAERDFCELGRLGATPREASSASDAQGMPRGAGASSGSMASTKLLIRRGRL